MSSKLTSFAICRRRERRSRHCRGARGTRRERRKGRSSKCQSFYRVNRNDCTPKAQSETSEMPVQLRYTDCAKQTNCQFLQF